MAHSNLLKKRLHAFQALLNKVGSIRISIEGNSMLPSLHDGDVVTIGKIPDNHDFKVGEIVLFQRYALLLLHRIISISGDCCFVKGDNEDEIDIVRGKNIIGILIETISSDSPPINVMSDEIMICIEEKAFRFVIEDGILIGIEVIDRR